MSNLFSCLFSSVSSDVFIESIVNRKNIKFIHYLVFWSKKLLDLEEQMNR